MAIHRVCDVCGREPALDLSRAIPTMYQGKRLLIEARVHADNGDAQPERLDIGIACLKLVVLSILVEG